MTTKVDVNSITVAELISRVERGEDLELERDGAPFARVVACEPKTQRKPPILGQFAGQIWMSPDFDDPMSEEELAEWYDAPLDTPGP